MERAVGLREGLLHEVLGISWIAGHPHGRRIQLIQVRQDITLEALTTPLLCLRYRTHPLRYAQLACAGLPATSGGGYRVDPAGRTRGHPYWRIPAPDHVGRGAVAPVLTSNGHARCNAHDSGFIPPAVSFACRGSGDSASHPVVLGMTCHAPGRFWLGFKAAIGNRAAAIDAEPVAAVFQPAQRLKYEHAPSFGRGEYRLGPICLRQVRSGIRRILRIVGDEWMLM